MKSNIKDDVYTGRFGDASDFLDENPDALKRIIKSSKVLKIRHYATRFADFIVGFAAAMIIFAYFYM